MKQEYLTLALLIERLHRRFLELIKHELEILHVEDINNVQMLILYNIGEETITVGELTNRGYYLGSNVSYNVKKLVENEYLIRSVPRTINAPSKCAYHLKVLIFVKSSTASMKAVLHSSLRVSSRRMCCKI